MLRDVGYIGSITLSGGEPSLAVQQIAGIRDVMVRLDVKFGSFYIATNGKKISEAFVIECLRWYSMAEEKDMCAVNVSNDYYHRCEGEYNTILLDGLSFFRRKHDKEGDIYTPLKQGRSKEGRDINKYHEKIYSDDNVVSGEVYVNCEGNVIHGCNWSYASQKKKENIFCHVSEFGEKCRQMIEKENANETKETAEV
jgi:hypothetical protein